MNLAYDDFLDPSEQSEIIDGLNAGTYQLLIWIDYTLYASINGVLFIDYGTLGSDDWLDPEASATITSSDLSNPIVIEALKVGQEEGAIVPIFDCVGSQSVFFELENVDELVVNQYTVTCEWAEVNNCNEIPLSYSDSEVSQLFGVYEMDPVTLTNVLRLNDIKDLNTLVGNPFLNPSNLGKTYKIRFTLSNPSCPDVTITQCVEFVSTPNIAGNFTLNLCQTSPDCMGGTASPYTSTPVSQAPLLGSSTASFNPTGTGLIEKYVVNIDHVGVNGNVITNVLEDYVVTPSESYWLNGNGMLVQFLNAYDFPENTTTGWAGGTGYFANHATQNNQLYFRLHIEVFNHCGQDDVWSYFRLDPDIDFIDPDNSAALENMNKNEFEVFPNPFVDQINISLPTEDCIINIFDFQGKLIDSFQSRDRMLSISSLALRESGSFILQCIDNSGMQWSKQIVKQ